MRTALYRHYDANNELLYVGISLSAVNRLQGHKRSAEWYDDIAFMSVEYFSTRAEAEAAETKAIREERPRHNIAKVVPSPIEIELRKEIATLKQKLYKEKMRVENWKQTAAGYWFDLDLVEKATRKYRPQNDVLFQRARSCESFWKFNMQEHTGDLDAWREKYREEMALLDTFKEIA